MKRNFFVLSALLVSISVFAKDDYSYETQKLLEKLEAQIKNTLYAIAESEKRAGKPMKSFTYNLELPAQEVVRLGLVIDPESYSEGIKVISVSPGSFADEIKIKSNDVITQVNGTRVTPENSRQVMEVLQKLTVGQSLSIEVSTKGKLRNINAQVRGEFLPGFKLAIGRDGALAENTQQIEQEPYAGVCGKVSVFFVPPLSMRTFPAYFSHIDGEEVSERRNSYRLEPGRHAIRLELLSRDQFLTRSKSAKQDVDELFIDVKPHRVYYLGVRYNPDKFVQDDKSGRWEAVVWKEAELTCEID